MKFTLRDDVTMSDGTPLVADDVVYSCNEIWAAKNQANDTGKYLVGATADDEHTVTIEFNTVAPDFLTMLSWTSFAIVSEDEVNAIGGLEEAAKSPTLGSGPYRFKEWKHGQYVILERNDDYWDKDYTGYFKTIKFVFTNDAAAREIYQANYTAEERAVDIEGAKALLAEAGYENGLEIKALGLSDITPVLTVMQANLAEVGITLTIDTPDTAQFVEGAFAGDYDITCVGDTPNMRTPASVMPFLTNANVYGSGMVIGGPKWTNDEFDTTIKELITAADNDKATEIATKLDEMVKEEMVCSNLYPETTGSVYAKDLKGYNTAERGYVDVTTLYK